MSIEVSLEGFPFSWSEGKELVDVEVTLGQNDKSSTCTVFLSDPKGEIAALLVSHTIKNGGIASLEGTNVANNSPVPTPIASSDGKVPVARGEGFSPNVLAFLDLIAYKEVPLPQVIQGYYSKNLGGYFPESEAQNGFPPSVGSTNVGRYQFNRDDYAGFKRFYPNTRDFLPATQDLMAVWKMQKQNKGWKELQAGDIRGAINRAAYNGRTGEWSSLPGGTEVQPGWTMDKALAYYRERLKYHNGNTSSTAPKVDLPQDISNLKPDVPAPVSNPVKGNKLTIDWGGQSFEFFHVGTETNENRITKVLGQGIRWVMNRRRRNKTLKELSLRDLAQSVATNFGVKLEWQSTLNPTYEHIDQSGISDYNLLIREANQAGLYVSEVPGTLSVKSREYIKDSGFLVSAGDNLVSYSIEDKALSKTEQENSALLQEEPKATVEPLTGALKQTNVDVDTIKDKSSTGKQAQPVVGKPSPGQDALINQSRARFKRVKGLPSTFTVITTAASLTLAPLTAIRTIGFQEVFNRIWLVDSVTHRRSKNTTTLNVYSPVEVVDVTAAPAVPPVTDSDTKVTGWVYPATGTVTSGYGARNTSIAGASKFHRAIDIANATGTPVHAANEGTVVESTFSGGAGNYVRIQHKNGACTRYLHNSQLLVRVGQSVKTGEVIALMGNTGIGSGSHCHFEYWTNGDISSRIDPSTLFPKLARIGNSIIGNSPV